MLQGRLSQRTASAMASLTASASRRILAYSGRRHRTSTWRRRRRAVRLRLLDGLPDIRAALTAGVAAFPQMVRTCDHAALDPWLRAAETGVVPEIRALAASLRRDYAALARPVGSAKRSETRYPWRAVWSRAAALPQGIGTRDAMRAAVISTEQGLVEALEPVMHFCHHRRDRQMVSVACKRKMVVTRGAQEPNRSTMPCSPPQVHAFTVRLPHACIARAAFGAVIIRKVHNRL
jgi:hypothetical protein